MSQFDNCESSSTLSYTTLRSFSSDIYLNSFIRKFLINNRTHIKIVRNDNERSSPLRWKFFQFPAISNNEDPYRI